jgi:hypothetical protein
MVPDVAAAADEFRPDVLVTDQQASDAFEVADSAPHPGRRQLPVLASEDG